jgi:hypothetical protein
MAFDLNSIVPPKDLIEERGLWHSNETNYKFFARWGATQAFEAMRHQMPTNGISHRPPTAEDADKGGYVQSLHSRSDGSVWWYLQGWELVAGSGNAWLHTPGWVLNPQLALKREGAALLNQILPTALGDGDTGLSSEQVALLRRVVALIQTEIPTKTSANTHKKTTSDTPVTIDGHIVKPGDRLILRDNRIITVHEISWGDGLWQISYRNDYKGYGYNRISVYADGKCPFDCEEDILAVVTGSL